jgi:hypothetical protein
MKRPPSEVFFILHTKQVTKEFNLRMYYRPPKTL